MPMRWSVLSVILLLAFPGAVAQEDLPGSPVAPAVELSVEAVNAGANLDEPATYTVTVSNTSPGSGSGQDPAMQVTLTVSSDTSGWTASLARSNFQIAPGDSADTTLTVTVSGNALRDAATITITATIRSGSPPLEETATATEMVDVLRDDSARRVVTETIGDYFWFIVAGGVVLYIISTALLVGLFRRRDRDTTDTQPPSGDDPKS